MHLKLRELTTLTMLSLSIHAANAVSPSINNASIISSHEQRVLQTRKLDCNKIDIDSQPNLCSPQLIWRNNKSDGKPVWRGDTGKQALDAFETGILPHAIKNHLPETEQVYDWDIHRAESIRSIFSSTTTDLETSLKFVPEGGGWVYEIYAPGGIDQEASVGISPSIGRILIAPFAERELSFPGGIKAQFIKSACYYKDKVKQECVDNKNFIAPTYQETPEEVAAAVVDLRKITPKARCDNSAIAELTPSALCFQPGMVSPVRYIDDLDRIKNVGLRVKYDLSDRGEGKKTQWILLTGNVEVDSIPSGGNPLPPAEILAQIPIPFDAHDTGEVVIPASLFKDVEFVNYPRRGDTWSIGIVNEYISDTSVTSDVFSGPISYIRIFESKKSYPQITTDSDRIVLAQGYPLQEKDVLKRLNAKTNDGSYIATDLTPSVFTHTGEKVISLYASGTVKTISVKIISSIPPAL